MGGDLWNPKTRFATKDLVYAFVELESGEFGVGEIWAAHGSPDSVVFIINNDFSPLLIGESPEDIDRLRDKVAGLAPMGSLLGLMMNAWSGIDVALWDLRGKLADRPLNGLLNVYSDSVYTYASGGLYGKNKGLDELSEEMRGYVELGFTGVKMKIGAVSILEDAERVAVVREAVGPGIRLMVDALHAYSVKEAMKMAEIIREHDIYWFESPVALEDPVGHGIVNTQSGIPVCGNESLTGVSQFQHLIEHNGVKFVHFDLSVCGGISEAIKIVSLADSEGLSCTLHAAGGVSLFSTSVQFASTIASCDSVEHHFVHRWLSDFNPEAMAHDHGLVKPSPAVGTGNLFINPEFVERMAGEELAKAN